MGGRVCVWLRVGWCGCWRWMMGRVWRQGSPRGTLFIRFPVPAWGGRRVPLDVRPHRCRVPATTAVAVASSALRALWRLPRPGRGGGRADAAGLHEPPPGKAKPPTWALAPTAKTARSGCLPRMSPSTRVAALPSSHPPLPVAVAAAGGGGAHGHPPPVALQAHPPTAAGGLGHAHPRPRASIPISATWLTRSPRGGADGGGGRGGQRTWRLRGGGGGEKGCRGGVWGPAPPSRLCNHRQGRQAGTAGCYSPQRGTARRTPPPMPGWAGGGCIPLPAPAASAPLPISPPLVVHQGFGVCGGGRWSSALRSGPSPGGVAPRSGRPGANPGPRRGGGSGAYVHTPRWRCVVTTPTPTAGERAAKSPRAGFSWSTGTGRDPVSLHAFDGPLFLGDSVVTAAAARTLVSSS